MHLAFRHGSDHLVIDVKRSADGHFLVTVNGDPHRVSADLITVTTLRTTIGDRTYLMHVARIGGAYHVALEGVTYVLEADTPAAATSDAAVFANPLVVAPMPGKVLKILVSVGQQVATGEPLLILEAMKMETRITADGAATVRRIPVAEGQMVEAGALLVELEPVA